MSGSNPERVPEDIAVNPGVAGAGFDYIAHSVDYDSIIPQAAITPHPPKERALRSALSGICLNNTI
ncbi:MAG: hypothetical protein OXH16_13040 [Gemmatimonadetes bacterium]|nr:hypothetical protein [Gemmatimonadota bacterium]